MKMAKKRQINFNQLVEILLLDEVQKRHDLLFGAFSGPGMGKKRKVTAWEEVASAFNSQTSQKREVFQLKKKYNNIKADAKVKLSKAKNPPTGGGPQNPSFTPAESLFLDYRGDDPSVSGIVGGLESGVDPELVMTEQEWVSPLTRVTMMSLVDVREAAEAETEAVVLPDLPTNEPIPSTSNDPRVVPTMSTQPELFPPPAAKKNKNPRSDKLRSDLEIEVLRLEKERVLAVMSLIQLKKKQAEKKHEAKLNLIKLKSALIQKQLNQML